MKYRTNPILRLTEAHPRWFTNGPQGPFIGILFDCPIHEECVHHIPFTNPIGGPPSTAKSATWNRMGETFEALTLVPSIRRIPHSHDDECEEGCEGDTCAWHGFITNGLFDNCSDAK